jgi:hypothetical protein
MGINNEVFYFRFQLTYPSGNFLTKLSLLAGNNGKWKPLWSRITRQYDVKRFQQTDNREHSAAGVSDPGNNSIRDK